MKKFLLAILPLVCGCSDPDLLVNQYEIQSHVYSNLTNNCTVKGQMLSARSAMLSAGQNVIFTNDDFETLQYVNYQTSLCNTEPLYMDGEHYWWYDRDRLYHTTPTLVNAEDLSFMDLRPIPESLGAFSMETRRPVFIDESHFYFIHPAHGAICEADVTQRTYSITEQLPPLINGLWMNYVSLFGTAGDLFVLAQDQNSITIDPATGQPTYDYYIVRQNEFSVWEANWVYKGERETSLTIEKKSGLIYAAIGDQYFLSSDNTKTWGLVEGPASSKILDIEIIDSHTLYAITGTQSEEVTLTIAELVKSTNRGETWETVTDQLYADEISFFDQDNGMAMSGYILQATNDGGETWQLIWNN